MLSIHVENIDFSNFTEFPHAFLQLSVLAFQFAALGFSIEEDVLDGVGVEPAPALLRRLGGKQPRRGIQPKLSLPAAAR